MSFFAFFPSFLVTSSGGWVGSARRRNAAFLLHPNFVVGYHIQTCARQKGKIIIPHEAVTIIGTREFPFLGVHDLPPAAAWVRPGALPELRCICCSCTWKLMALKGRRRLLLGETRFSSDGQTKLTVRRICQVDAGRSYSTVPCAHVQGVQVHH